MRPTAAAPKFDAVPAGASDRVLPLAKAQRHQPKPGLPRTCFRSRGDQVFAHTAAREAAAEPVSFRRSIPLRDTRRLGSVPELRIAREGRLASRNAGAFDPDKRVTATPCNSSAVTCRSPFSHSFRFCHPKKEIGMVDPSPAPPQLARNYSRNRGWREPIFSNFATLTKREIGMVDLVTSATPAVADLDPMLQ